ncbi:MAG TPA: coproporphyrinogen III oxidase, partial [Saprospiraceae bacterium]|nr:coproporphyrinogen III oxidase [Saprospiraceae bacterium]
APITVTPKDHGGGGKTRIISGGNVFEKGGVNTSVVFGEVTPMMTAQLKIHGHQWCACGLSLVLHPYNPFVPTVHCNYRMFELYDEKDTVIDRWFGGGTDLTPYYLFEEDAVHFHRTYKTICDRFDPSFYPVFKQQLINGIIIMFFNTCSHCKNIGIKYDIFRFKSYLIN